MSMDFFQKILKFVPVAQAIAQMSKNPKRKIGALILSKDLVIISSGYNWLPRKVHEFSWRLEQPEKQYFMCHAEQNAIAQAARTGAATDGCYMIVTGLMPCSTCARLMVQAGIKMVAYPASTEQDAKWGIDFMRSSLLLEEGGVEVLTFEETALWTS